MSVVVAVRDEDKIWLATDSQVTMGWTKSLLLSQHSFKIFKCKNNVNIGGVGALRDLNIISTSDTDFISENHIYKKDIAFKNVVRETVPKFFKELKEFGRLYTNNGITHMDSAFIIAHGDSCFAIDPDGCVRELNEMFAIGSGADVAESAYTVLRDTELPAKEKAIRAVMSSCERDIFVDYPIVVTNTEMDNFEIFDGEYFYTIKENGELEQIETQDTNSDKDSTSNSNNEKVLEDENGPKLSPEAIQAND